MSIYSDPYWKRREEADEEQESAPEVESAEGAQVAAPAVESPASERTDSEGAFAPMDVSTPDPLAGKPELGPVEPPPQPPDVAPTPPGPPEAPEFDPYQPSAPKADAAPDMKAEKLKAIAEARRMASAPIEAPEGLRDADLAAAGDRDRQRVQRSNLSETIRAAFARQTPRLQQEPSEADALSHRRALSDKTAASGLNRKLDLESRLIAAMKGENSDPDGSLAQRRKDLAEEAKNRLALSREQLAAVERERKTKGELAAKELEERIRHNKEIEKGKQKPTGPGRAASVKAGDISTVPENLRNVVKAIAEGRLEAPKAAAKYGAEVVQMVMNYKPDFDATRFGAYKKVVEGQATDKSKLAIDVAANHLEEAERLVPQNYDPRMLNRVKNAFVTGSGSEELSAFELAMLSSAHEIAKTFGIEDQQGKLAIEHMFDPTQSPQQLRARIAQARKLMAGKTEGFKRQRDAVAPDGGKKPEAAGQVRVRRKSDGVVAPVAADVAKRLIAKGTYEPE